jgi:hypothetical protein
MGKKVFNRPAFLETNSKTGLLGLHHRKEWLIKMVFLVTIRFNR